MKYFNHPLINGILIINDNIRPIIKLIDMIFMSLYIMHRESIKVIVYKIPLKSKYHIPMLKHDANIKNMIILSIIIDYLLLLLAYQAI